MLRLFWTFSKIGLFTIGGGYAMVPLLESEIVDKGKYLTKEEFVDILAVSQASPGLFAVNMASHIGNKLYGTKGGVICSLGAAMPSVICILLIAMFFQAFKGNIYVEKIFRGVRPAVVALIAAPCFSLARSAKLNRQTIWVPVVCCILIAFLGVSPVWIILAAALSGFFYGKFISKE